MKYASVNPSAQGIFYDDTIVMPISGGNSVQEELDYLKYRVGGEAGGITPFFQFGRSGGLAPNAYFNVGPGNVPSSTVGQFIPGNNKITSIAIELSNTINTATTCRLQERTAINTFTNIAGSDFIVPVGSWFFKYIYPSPILITDIHLAAYSVSGVSLQNPQLYVFVAPQ